MPTQGSPRRTAQRRAAAEVANQAEQAREEAEQAREGADQARQEADQARDAEKVAVAAAELAVEAARDAEAEREAAAFPQRVVLMPSQELRSLVASVIEGMQGAGYPGAAGGASPVGSALTAEQEYLTLDYDVLRTALARYGAASIVFYERDSEERIKIEQGVADGSFVVVYGRRSGQPDDPSVEIGRARYQDGFAVIPGLRPDTHIDRVEVLDRHGRPVRLGLPADRPMVGRPGRPS